MWQFSIQTWWLIKRNCKMHIVWLNQWLNYCCRIFKFTWFCNGKGWIICLRSKFQRFLPMGKSAHVIFTTRSNKKLRNLKRICADWASVQTGCYSYGDWCQKWKIRIAKYGRFEQAIHVIDAGCCSWWEKVWLHHSFQKHKNRNARKHKNNKPEEKLPRN